MTHPIRAAVIGHPIKHSKSPMIHGHWIAQYGLNGSYEAIDIAPDNLPARIAQMVADGYAGFNVTIPHKEAIFKLCDEVDEKARLIGAVNTVKIEHGKLYGTNTDAFGFIENIKQDAPGFNFAAGAALVLGAGGAARAVVYGLLQEGAEHITITNRTRDKAEAIAAMAPGKISVIDWNARNDAVKNAALIINTTALGMAGKDPLDVSLDRAQAGAIVTDIVYTPLMTDLLKQAKTKQLQYVTGIGMLLHQARPAFHLWFGVMPQVDDALRARVLA